MRRNSINIYAGFTLIEVLVVIFIISIVTSVAMLSISRNENKRLETFAKEFEQILTLAEEQAMLQPAVLGFNLEDHAFHFSIYLPTAKKNENPWRPLDDKLLGTHEIPKEVQISMPGNINTPQIVISTNGDITPFTLYIGKPGKRPRYQINGNADGEITTQLLS